MKTPNQDASFNTTKTLESSKSAWARLGALGILIAVIPLIAPASGSLKILGFGLLALGFFIITLTLVGLYPGANLLELGPLGFRQTSFFKKKIIPWRDVESFKVSRGRWDRVTYNLLPNSAPPSALPAPLTIRLGYDGALRETYGLRAIELCELMNEYRIRAGGAPTKISPEVVRPSLSGLQGFRIFIGIGMLIALPVGAAMWNGHNSYSIAHQAHLSIVNQGLQTAGVIEDITHHHVRAGSFERIRYTFSLPDNKEMTGTIDAFGFARHHPGETVDIVYLATNPHLSLPVFMLAEDEESARRMKKADWMIPLIGAGVWIFIGAILFLLLRKPMKA